MSAANRLCHGLGHSACEFHFKDHWDSSSLRKRNRLCARSCCSGKFCNKDYRNRRGTRKRSYKTTWLTANSRRVAKRRRLHCARCIPRRWMKEPPHLNKLVTLTLSANIASIIFCCCCFLASSCVHPQNTMRYVGRGGIGYVRADRVSSR